MNFAQFLLILRARAKVILFTLAMTIAIVLVVSLLMTKTYKATTTLVLNYKGADPVTGNALPAQLLPSYVATQVDIIHSRNVALKVVDALGLANMPAIKQRFYAATDNRGDIREWLAEALLHQVTVDPSRESNVLNISFKDSDPQLAAAVANAFATAYEQVNVQLKAEPMRQASDYISQQIKTLRSKLEAARTRLSAYQQETGVVSVGNQLGIENARLNDLATQLDTVEGQLMDAVSRQRQANGVHGSESPDVIANPLVQNLKSSLAQAEGHLADIAARLGVNHPQYQAEKAQVNMLRAQLNRAINETSNSVANNARILSNREAALRAALEGQKKKVLELNRTRDMLAIMTQDVENAQRAYDTALQRYTQTNLEGHSNQADVAVLNPAVPPVTPDSPRIFLNGLIAVFLGVVLGVGAGVLTELMDRRVRSVRDLAEGLEIPVLAVLEKSRSTRLRFG